MMEYPAPLARLIDGLCKLPGIGEKTAGRLAFHLLKTDRDEVLRLAASIEGVVRGICLCPVCFGFERDRSRHGSSPGMSNLP